MKKTLLTAWLSIVGRIAQEAKIDNEKSKVKNNWYGETFMMNRFAFRKCLKELSINREISILFPFRQPMIKDKMSQNARNRSSGKNVFANLESEVNTKKLHEVSESCFLSYWEQRSRLVNNSLVDQQQVEWIYAQSCTEWLRPIRSEMDGAEISQNAYSNRPAKSNRPEKYTTLKTYEKIAKLAVYTFSKQA